MLFKSTINLDNKTGHTNINIIQIYPVSSKQISFSLNLSILPICQFQQHSKILKLSKIFCLLIQIIKMQDQKNMKCIMMLGPSNFQLKEVPIGKPNPGEVLVKVMAAPLNPSDQGFLKGTYPGKNTLPTIPGFQGAGIVVESGQGQLSQSLLNKKVGFSATNGSYAQYTIVSAGNCIQLSEEISYQQGSMCIVNPLTVIAMLDKLRTGNHKSVIHTAAASQLGRMLNRVLIAEGIDIINVVRRKEQVQILKSEGAKYVLNSSEANFEQELKDLAQKLNTTMAYDAVCGKMTGILLKSMPTFSTVEIYGSMSNENPLDIRLRDLLFMGKTLKGFALPQWLVQKKKSIYEIAVEYKVDELLKNQLKSQIAKEFSLQQFKESIQFYGNNMSNGKILIKPWNTKKM